MAKGVIALHHLGRFGNQIFGYAFARSYAERNNLELQTDPWIGQRVFGLNDPPIANPESLKRVDENTIEEGMSDVLYRSYSQQNKCLTYTRRDCFRWFNFSDEIKNALKDYDWPQIVAHRRVGDYPGWGSYPVVSEASYHRAMKQYYPTTPLKLRFVTEENPTIAPLPDELKDIADFYLMTQAYVLFRGNSTYSWWAATLNPVAHIYSPVVDGLPNGEQECRFVPGNWPRFANMEFTTDLHLPE